MKKNSPWAWVPSLYFAEGLPNVAVVTIAMLMYKRLGLDNEQVTLYTSWLSLPWVIKPFWSPFVDILKTKRWWIITMQLLIGAALGGVAFSIPGPYWLQATMCFLWLLSFSSATHDIATDGFYMLGLDQHQQAYFVGVRSTFYRISLIFGQGFLISLSGNLEWYTRDIRYSWSLLFYLMAGMFIGFWLYHHYVLPHPKENVEEKRKSLAEIMDEFVATIGTFFTKKNVLVSIFFMLFYRMPEGLLSKISPLFLIDPNSKGGLGLSTSELGFVQGTVGVIGLLLGGILGGMAVSRDGFKRWLWPMVCAITIPDLVYVYLSFVLPSNLWIINLCVFFEQFGYGFGFTAYMMFLLYYSRGEHKTSHYALCTAFMTLSLMVPGLFAGALQKMVGYQMFFVIVILCCSVTFLVSAIVKIDPYFGKKQTIADQDNDKE